MFIWCHKNQAWLLSLLSCYYGGKDCIKKLSTDLKYHAAKIISYEKKGIIPLTNEVNKSYRKQKCATNDDDKKYHKAWDHCHYTGKYRGAAHNTSNLGNKIPKKSPIVFHNGSKCDYHFIVKELAE